MDNIHSEQEFIVPLSSNPTTLTPKKETHLSLKWTNNVKGSVWKANPLLAEGKLFTATIDDANNLCVA
jgi:hypothetical protein